MEGIAFVVAAAVAGAIAGWITNQRASTAREVERAANERATRRLEQRLGEQRGCLVEYLRLSSELLGDSAERRRVETRFFSESARVRSMERHAERLAAPLLARAATAFTSEIIEDLTDTLRHLASARYRLDTDDAERSARELDERCQRAMLDAIHESERALGLPEPSRTPIATLLPQRLGIVEASPDRALAAGQPNESWAPCATCGLALPPHFDFCQHCGERRMSTSDPFPSTNDVIPASNTLPPDERTVRATPRGRLPSFDADTMDALFAERLLTTADDIPPELLEQADVRVSEPPPTSVPPRWSVLVANGTPQEMSFEELSECLQDGRVAPGTLVRKEGMASYVAVDEFSELSARDAVGAD